MVPESDNLLENEFLAAEREWTLLQVNGTLPVPPERLVIRRDRELNVLVEFTGDCPLPAPRRPSPVPGTLVQHQDLVVQTADGTELQLVDFADSQWSVRGMEPAKMTVSGVVRAVEAKFSDEEPDFATEWVVGLALSRWSLPDATERDHSVHVTRARGAWGLDGGVRPARGGVSRDHARLNISDGDKSFAVCIGHPERENEALGSGFVEFEGSLPDRALRDRLRGAIGFAFGRAVHSVGWTRYTSKGDVCSARSEAAYSPGGSGQLGSAALPPTHLGGEQYLTFLDSDKLARLISGLLSCHEEYELGHLYWLLWHGAAGTLDLAAGEYGSALEHLRKRYYLEENRSKRTKLLPKPDWKRVRTRLVEVLDEEFASEDADLEHARKIFRNKVGNLNQVPGGEGSRRFFEDLDLEIGDVEQKGMDLRNPASHGVALDPTEHANSLRRLRALQTLVNRVVLAISGGSDTYTDYSTEGFPERPLSEKQGGPAGDGVSA